MIWDAFAIRMHHFLTPARETTYSKLRTSTPDEKTWTVFSFSRWHYESCCRAVASLASVSGQRSCHRETTMARETQCGNALNATSSLRRTSIDDEQDAAQEEKR